LTNNLHDNEAFKTIQQELGTKT